VSDPSPAAADAAASLSDSPLASLAEQVASSDPAPGAGPSMAWTCTLAAALVEMVCAVSLRKAPVDAEAMARRRERAAALRARALDLADQDVAAYSQVLAALRERGAPGHGVRLRQALSDAADPPLAIVEIATEVTHLAADAAAEARGAVRGEALTAAVLAEAVVRAGIPLVALNLASAPEDSRRTRLHDLAETARAGLDRALQT
jgi:formiminotetrahydrofolate cyclodeaminase